MFPDVLRTFAGPMLNSLSQVANAARQPAAAPAQTQTQKPGGLQVLDGFDDPLPAVQRAASTVAPTAAGGVDQPGAQGLAAGQDALAQNPIAKLAEVFTSFIKQFFAMFFGGQGAEGGQAQTPAVGGAAGARGPAAGAPPQTAQGVQGGAGAADAATPEADPDRAGGRGRQPRVDGDRGGEAAAERAGDREGARGDRDDARAPEREGQVDVDRGNKDRAPAETSPRDNPGTADKGATPGGAPSGWGDMAAANANEAAEAAASRDNQERDGRQSSPDGGWSVDI